MSHPRAGRTRRGVAAACASLVLLAGCELEVEAGLEVDRNGSGAAGLTLRVDEAMLDELDAVALDPTAELAAVVAATDGWTLERAAADGGLEVTARHAAADPAALTDALAELSAGLSDDDPALVVDLDLEVDAEGAATLVGEVSLRAPAGPGSVGDPELPDAAAMAELTSRHVTATVAVTLPAAATSHDADAVDGRTLRWEVPVGASVPVTATSPAPSALTLELAAVGAGALLLLVTAGVVWIVRRRGAA